MTAQAIAFPADVSELPAVAQTCPLDVAISLIEGRWKLHILRALFVHGTQRYNGLLRAVEGISAKELTRNLRELEKGRLILRDQAEGEVRYCLSSLGQELLPTFRELGQFGSLLAARQR